MSKSKKNTAAPTIQDVADGTVDPSSIDWRNAAKAKCGTDGEHEFNCPECGLRCTRSPTKPSVEYGHRRSIRNDGEDCPRRPTEMVDPAGPQSSRYSAGDRE